MIKSMLVSDIKGGYYFEFFRYGKSVIDISITFEDDTPVAKTECVSYELSADEIEMYTDWAKRTALMFQE